MPRIQVDLDQHTFDQLVASASAERRLVPKQAEVLLIKALGLEFPIPIVQGATMKADKPKSHI